MTGRLWSCIRVWGAAAVLGCSLCCGALTPACGEEAAVTPAMIAKYEGDWVGALSIESDSAAFADWDQTTWELFARFSFSGEGELTPFLRAGFSDQAYGDAFNFKDLSGELDPWFEDIFLTGSLLGAEMTNPTNLSFTYSGDGSIVIHTVLEGYESGTAEVCMTLRRVGDPWTGEEEPGLDPERSAAWSGMTLEEIMAEAGFETKAIPAASHVGVADPSAEYALAGDDPYAPEEDA